VVFLKEELAVPLCDPEVAAEVTLTILVLEDEDEEVLSELVNDNLGLVAEVTLEVVPGE